MRIARQIASAVVVAAVVVGAATLAGWKLITDFADSHVWEKQWSTSSVFEPAEDNVVNDVWAWHKRPSIRPLAIQRVEWNQKNIIARDSWGRFHYYKALITDPEIERSVRAVLGKLPPYSGLPRWAKHQPSWWNPEFQLEGRSGESLLSLIGLDEAYVVANEEDVIVFWVGWPYEGRRMRGQP